MTVATNVSTANGRNGRCREAQRYRSWGIDRVWIVNPQTWECFEYHGGSKFTIVQDTLRGAKGESEPKEGKELLQPKIVGPEDSRSFFTIPATGEFGGQVEAQ